MLAIMTRRGFNRLLFSARMRPVITVLEIRKFDDSRGGFPDTNRGAVMLYLANSPPILPQVSSHELMRINRTRLNQIPPPPPDQIPNASYGPDNPPPNKPANIDATLDEPAPTKSLKDMTAEEIQAERRKRKAQEAAGKPGRRKHRRGDRSHDGRARRSDVRMREFRVLGSSRREGGTH